MVLRTIARPKIKAGRWRRAVCVAAVALAVATGALAEAPTPAPTPAPTLSHWAAVLWLDEGLLDPAAWTPIDIALNEEHFVMLKTLAAEGVVVHAGRVIETDEKDFQTRAAFGFVIFAAESERAVREVLERDAAIRAGQMRYDLYPYRIALGHGPSR